MDDYSKLSASDGTGEAVVANVETDRLIGAATLNVDNVDNWPAEFICVTGTLNPNNYIDNSSMTIFYGHLDAGNIVIDSFAPGYTDVGNTAGQIAIIKPTTEWVNQVVELAMVAHQDNGKLKNTSLDEFYKPSDNAGSWVVSGGIIAQTAGLTGSFSNIVYYILGLRYTKSSVANFAYIASKDTYVDIDAAGTVDYNDVANGAAAPALAAGNIRLAKVVTNGSAITSVTQSGLDSLGHAIYNTSSTVVEKYFTTTGANTWTKPEGLKYIVVEVQAGGGGGGGTAATNAAQLAVGSGGGGGGYARKKVNAVSLGATETATVGAGGAGVSGAAGAAGSSSSFGAHASATGGTGGTTILDANTVSRFDVGVAGGVGTGDFTVAGGPGFGGIIDKNNNNIARGGWGGNAFLGAGGRGGVANNNGVAAGTYGGGGGACAKSSSQSASTGGAGGQGIIIVREYF